MDDDPSINSNDQRGSNKRFVRSVSVYLMKIKDLETILIPDFFKMDREWLPKLFEERFPRNLRLVRFIETYGIDKSFEFHM